MDCVDEKEGMAVVLLLQKHLYLTLLIEEDNIFISESNEFQSNETNCNDKLEPSRGRDFFVSPLIGVNQSNITMNDDRRNIETI